MISGTVHAWKKILDRYGWLIPVVLIIFVFAWAAYVFNPVQELEDRVAEPIGREIGLSPGLGCHDGWQGDQVSDDAEGHTQSSCSRAGWTVYLNSDNKFAFALPPGGGEFVYDESRIPGW